jgi:colicin import membrane protein
MIRKHENSDSWKAGFYAVGVHAILLAAMLISFNWKAAHPVLNVTEVELWDKIPKTNPPVVQPEPKPVIEEKPEPKPEPKPMVEEKPKPEEPKVDIELEKKKKELEQKKAEEEKLEQLKKQDELRKKEVEEKRKKLAQQMREEDLKEKAETKKEKDAALKKLQQEALSEDNGADDKKASSSANASLIGEYTEKIKAKIRGNVNKTLCGDGNPELRFEIGLLPTGELSGAPSLVKSSGNSACDDAVERAITASQPLPLPDDASLKAQFKNLKLKFRPND